MRTRKLVLAFLVVTVGFFIASLVRAGSRPDPIEGIGGVKLCMKEWEFVSKVLPRLGPYEIRQAPPLLNYLIVPDSIIWPPRSGLIPDSIHVSVREGVVNEIWIIYDPFNDPSRNWGVYKAVRRYIPPDYVLGPLSFFLEEIMGVTGGPPYEYGVAFNDGTFLDVSADPPEGGTLVVWGLARLPSIPHPSGPPRVCWEKP